MKRVSLQREANGVPATGEQRHSSRNLRECKRLRRSDGVCGSNVREQRGCVATSCCLETTRSGRPYLGGEKSRLDHPGAGSRWQQAMAGLAYLDGSARVPACTSLGSARGVWRRNCGQRLSIPVPPIDPPWSVHYDSGWSGCWGASTSSGTAGAEPLLPEEFCRWPNIDGWTSIRSAT